MCASTCAMRWVRCGRRGAAGFTAALLLRRTLVVLEEIEDERLRCRVELAISARAGGGRVGGRIVVGRRGRAKVIISSREVNFLPPSVLFQLRRGGARVRARSLTHLGTQYTYGKYSPTHRDSTRRTEILSSETSS